MIKKILIALVAIFILLQVIRPVKNLSGDKQHDISTKYNVPTEVAILMNNACNNCHSNLTKYPWYYNIQPVAWWMTNHINDAKRGLNFSEFTSRKIAWQNKKFKDIIENVKEKEMPLPSYTWLGMHPEARMTDADRQLIIDWATAQMDTLKAHYPADSLKMPKRQASPPK